MSRSSGDAKTMYRCGFCGRRIGGHGNFSSHEGAHARAGDTPSRENAGDRYARLVWLVADQSRAGEPA